MHTTESTRFRFHHNGDFSGDVIAVDKATNVETHIPFTDIKTLVAEQVRRERIARLEDASDDEILSG